MDFPPHGSSPGLSWQPHAWATMQDAAAEDGAFEAPNQISIIGNPCTLQSHGFNNTHKYTGDDPNNDRINPDENLTKSLPARARYPVPKNHDATYCDGSYTHQRKEDNFTEYGVNSKNNVTTRIPLWAQYHPFNSSPNIAVAGQSPDSYAMPGLGRQFVDTFVPCDHHIGHSSFPVVSPVMSSTATVNETPPLTSGQNLVNNSPRFPCLHPGCVRTFGRSADLDRHFKKHVPSAAKFYCYEIGCKFNGKPFYRRDKLLSHKRNMHGE